MSAGRQPKRASVLRNPRRVRAPQQFGADLTSEKVPPGPTLAPGHRGWLTLPPPTGGSRRRNMKVQKGSGLAR